MADRNFPRMRTRAIDDRASPRGDAHRSVPAGVKNKVQCGDGDRHPSRRASKGGKWRMECRIGVWNVRGGINEKMNELIDIMKERQLDVVCLSETKRKGSEIVDLPGGALALWSGVPQQEHGSRGVGVLLSSRLASCIRGYELGNPRLLWVRLKVGMTKIFLVAAYAPVSSSLQSDLEEFWTNVRDVLDKAEGNEKIILCGDLNGWVGTARTGYETVLGRYGDTRVNEAGKFILDVCKEKNLFVSNTIFDHKRIHQYTWERKNERSMIDLFLVDERLRYQTLDTRVYRGADLGTDHFLVITRIRGLFAGWHQCAEYSTTKVISRVRTWRLQDATTRRKYHKCVSSKLANSTNEISESVEACWKNLRISMNEAAKEICGIMKGRSSKKGDAWWDDEVKESVCKKKEAWLNVLATSSAKEEEKIRMKDLYRQQKRETKALVDKKRERCQLFVESRLSSNFRDNAKLFWREVRNSRVCTTTCRMNIVLSKTNVILSDRPSVLQRWSEFYGEMYDCETMNLECGVGPPNNQITTPDEDVISMEEIERAIRSLKCGKAAGMDEITAEMIKYGGPSVWDHFYLLCNNCWQTGEVPEVWRRAVIVPFYKGKGTRLDCSSYRAISLVSLASKVYTKILTKRMQEVSEEFLWEAQCGFRPGRGCMDQIFSLRGIIEKFLAVDQRVFCAFVDLEKAFDRVLRKDLWQLLPRYGVKGRLLQAVKSLYCDNKACVRVDGELSPWFDVLSGVKQGCVMSAWLFILYLDSCLSELKESKCGVKMGDLVVNCLLYADDAVLIADSESGLQTLVTCMKDNCERKGLRLNVNKTKVLVFERNDVRTDCEIKVNNESLEQVNEIVYLGCMFSRNGMCDIDVERRVTAGNKVNGALGAVLKSKNITQTARIAVHRAVLVPTLLYGSEAWVCQKKHESRINAVEMRSLRSICGVTLEDCIRNEEIRRMVDLKDGVIDCMHRGMLRWFGHVERMNDERMTKKIYNANVSGSRGRGRPRLTYADQIGRVLLEGNVKSTRNRRECMKGLMNVKEAKEVCKNREKWRSILSAYPSRDSA